MSLQRIVPLALLALLLAACGGTPPSDEPGAEPTPTGSPLDAEDPSILQRPFTADQIREAWVEGLRLRIRRSGPEGEVFERWTVVAADARGAQIESIRLDPEGNPVGEPRVQPAGWVELRDHATFSAKLATREDETRDTALGQLEGWLYTVQNPAEGSVTEFFFARKLAGAPVYVRTTRGGRVVSEMEQLERTSP